MRVPFRSQAGFTLVEMIVVILLMGILAGIGVSFITRPMESYVDLTRRAELVAAAENALRRMQRDIRQALPNSVRVSADGRTLELLYTVDGGRYRAQEPGDVLDLTAPAGDASFDALGPLRSDPPEGQWVVLYNIAPSGTVGNAYFGDNRATLDAGASSSTLITLNPAFHFPLPSPRQRFFLVQGPVAYVCDPVAGTLTRRADYTMLADTPPAAFADGSATLMANHVAACGFTYTAGTSQRAGLATLQLTLSDSGEQINLLHQVHVDNAP